MLLVFINFNVYCHNVSLLNNTSRGILEQIIDTCITAIPTWMPDYRKDEVKKIWMYDKAEDFVLGLAFGMIYAYFEGTFLTIYHRQIDPQERVEVMSVITLRMPQIREALFSTG